MTPAHTILIQAAVPLAFALLVGVGGCIVAWWTKPKSSAWGSKPPKVGQPPAVAV